MVELIPLLPHLQAILNLTTVCLLILAYSHIRRKNKAMHRKYMLSALTVSGIFMISYLTYHGQVGYVPFEGRGAVRPIYFSILASHIVLAAAIIPLVLTTAFLAFRANFQLHRRWAIWTFPIWLYVSISGVIVYLMAFHIYPPQMDIS